jgi:DNA-directed RNA polymerase specialized sigma subunit
MMLEVFHMYNDLCREIDILEIQIYELKQEQEDWWIGGRWSHLIPLHKAAERWDNLNAKIIWAEEVIKNKIDRRNQFEQHLKSMNQLEYQVAYARYVEKKTLEEIADELHYSIDWIKRVSSKISIHFNTLTS